jgi:PAS domain S-box-containing protein
MVNSDSAVQMPSVRPVLVLSGAALTALLGLSLWLYIEGTGTLRAHARTPADPTAAQNTAETRVRLLQEMDGWATKVTLANAAGATGLTFLTALSLMWWRRSWMHRLARTSQEWQQGSRKASDLSSQLQLATMERKRLEHELQRLQTEVEKRIEERTGALAKSYALLEAELNERKQAERALAQQAQELGRSKDVLELHVQARTQELQKLKSRYEHILNSAGEGIYGCDLQGRTTFVNPAAAKLTGYKVEELVGKPEHEVFWRGQPHSESGAPKSGEAAPDRVFVRKDSTTFAVEYVRAPIMEKDKVVGAVVIFKDITERKRAEEALAHKAAELARSNAELEQFAYVASHDLQEPLRKIQAFGDRLKGKVHAAGLQEGRDYLERMQNAAARMQTLINDLLTFSRVISANQPFVTVDLKKVTKEVLTDLEVRIEQTKARVEVGELPSLEADPMQMRQLLQNLIGNALKFQPPGQAPVVKISAQVVKTPFAGTPEAGPLDEVVELSIQDNGIGFDEKYTDKIFAMFQRLHGRSEYEGTGVGLPVCRRITDRHGGTIRVKSSPGQGATFIVTLPVHPGNGGKQS